MPCRPILLHIGKHSDSSAATLTATENLRCIEMDRIYLTHCSHKKDEQYRISGEPVGAEVLYTAAPTQRFMRRCKDKRVAWAIFSDKYGVWFPEVRHEWYEKDPDTVTKPSAVISLFQSRVLTKV